MEKVIIRCKKTVITPDDLNIPEYIENCTYEGKIVGDDILAKGEYSEFTLIGVKGESAKDLNVKTGSNGWDNWFNEYFEIIR